MKKHRINRNEKILIANSGSSGTVELRLAEVLK